MERPILTLTTKDFLTGIAPAAHTERGGLLLSAAGVTPVYDPGGTASVENGLLQAGPTPTDLTGAVVVDTIFASTPTVASDFLFLYGNAGHLYEKTLGSNTIVDDRSGTPITNPANGLAIWGPAGGTNTLYYWQKTQIGRYTGGAYPTGWTDNMYTGLTSTSLHPTHPFLGNLYYGNFSTVGALIDQGAATVSHSTNVLDIKLSEIITALSDDGVFLVIAATPNQTASSRFARNTIYFWDTSASSWARDYEIRDPFIFSLKRVGNVVIAFGQYGVYEVSFGGGVRKLLNRNIGFGTTADVLAGYGTSRASVYNNQAILFATDSTIDSFGPLSIELPSAYFKPFKVPSGVGTPTLVETLFEPGRVYVATDGNKLYAYDFNFATRETSVSFQTIYFPFREPTQVHRIDVIFGEPLASGDAFDIDTKIDEDTSAVDFDAASFTNDGAIRRKEMHPAAPVQVNNQLSITGNFTAGAAKIKSIQIYGQPLTLGTS